MIEQIARYLCRADGYDPDIAGLSGNPRWWLYTRTAEHTLPLLAKAWDEGNDAGWAEANAHHENAATYPKLTITNPYRQETAR